ncbi:MULTISPECIES: hypothetical protein [unclassified Streptomyces]|uniref:hypothetical protein n=1 Tax=unclassified Streptomyces TaxID=2593676 RepID=UPI002475C3A2|nr:MULTISPECIES: hypothetical protein [unclassified Streptomyces]
MSSLHKAVTTKPVTNNLEVIPQQEELVVRSNRNGHGSEDRVPDPGDRLTLLRWHLDRYDRLRASTASRASVVLSAGAILSAGNAVVLARLIDSPDSGLSSATTLAFGLGLLLSVGLVVLSLTLATGVLVTPKPSRDTFMDARNLPAALVFNPTDTVRELESYEDFRSSVESQSYQAILAAAQIELWIGIRQHRHRYLRLRAATRVLRWAAVVFVVSLTGFVIAMLSKSL